MNLISAYALLAISVAIHATGLILLLQWILRTPPNHELILWKNVWMLIRVSWIIVALHLTEILIWAGFYVLADCMPDMDTAFYFSSVTYTTVGYGDLLLPEEWWGARRCGSLDRHLDGRAFNGFLLHGAHQHDQPLHRAEVSGYEILGRPWTWVKRTRSRKLISGNWMKRTDRSVEAHPFLKKRVIPSNP